jgi:seryl-tRNA synthetase
MRVLMILCSFCCCCCQVEMFVLSTPEQSDTLHQELINIEQELFTEMGLHFKVTVISYST